MKALKNEIDAVAKLLVAGADTPEDLAKLVIEAVDVARTERVTYYAIFRFSSDMNPIFSGFGPFSTKNQAVRAIEKHPAAGMAKGLAVVPVLNEQGFEALIAGVDAPAVPRGDWAQVRKDAESFRAGRKVSR